MEEKLECKLNEIYVFPIEVSFSDFRLYEIRGKINEKEFCFPFIYNALNTFDYNIRSICQKIDFEILDAFKKRRKNDKN